MSQPKTLNIDVVGMIGETSEFLKYLTHGMTDITIDMKKMTYMNSIGVKHWILWVNKLPEHCKVTLHNCPFMIASQASMVTGFLTKNMTIESFHVPYLCTNCEEETIVLIKRGLHYDLATPEKAHWVALPKDIKCPKCKPDALCEPDLFEEKTFLFLKR